MSYRRGKVFNEAWKIFDAAVAAGYPQGFLRPIEIRAENGDFGALDVLYTVYNDGVRRDDGRWIVRKNTTVARRYEERSAALGEPEAMTAIAGRLRRNKRTFKHAVRLYKVAFEKGYDTAAYNLAHAYKELGKFALSVTWFRKAASAGDISALFEVAIAELYGVGTRRDSVAAFSKLRRVARSRAVFIPEMAFQIQAMLTMARSLGDGWLIPLNTTAAMKLFARAASLGSAVAKAEMGMP
jgi:TPR repeat protein